MYDEKTFQNTYQKGDLLAVTICPDDKMQGFNTPTRYLDFKSYYCAKLNRLAEDGKLFQYNFRLELSEPIGEVNGEGPRLHLHGVIKLPTNLSVFKWLNDVMPDLLIHARLKIDHIKDEAYLAGWYKYCYKQLPIMPVMATINNQDWYHFTCCAPEPGPPEL